MFSFVSNIFQPENMDGGNTDTLMKYWMKYWFRKSHFNDQWLLVINIDNWFSFKIYLIGKFLSPIIQLRFPTCRNPFPQPEFFFFFLLWSTQALVCSTFHDWLTLVAPANLCQSSAWSFCSTFNSRCTERWIGIMTFFFKEDQMKNRELFDVPLQNVSDGVLTC